ncbi:MBG domain-containing protein, partial [Fulvivirga lutimaris]|uniref:MBG domain-containing protein n=1 Tax=Fulvivirga lutimaris TaxID=1819566 RepID=UPI0016275114|nr:hypothetical protein [Fulvivirga lutimaris]
MRAFFIILTALLLVNPVFGFVPPSFTTTTVPNGEYKSAYYVDINVEDLDLDPISLALTSGVLPAGMSFLDNGNGTGTGTLSGTPTETGDFTFEITATANGESVLQSFDLTIDKATATITISNTTQVYDGSPKPITAVASETVAGIDVTYDLSSTPPTDAGTYAIVATINDPNYQGVNGSESLIINKATATITISNTTQVYDGSPKPITAVASETVAGIDVTYDLSSTPPTNAGTYDIIATINDPNYQ